MKIVEESTVSFALLDVAQCFRFQGKLMLKCVEFDTNGELAQVVNEPLNAVDLEEGKYWSIQSNIKVKPVNAEVVLK